MWIRQGNTRKYRALPELFYQHPAGRSGGGCLGGGCGSSRSRGGSYTQTVIGVVSKIDSPQADIGKTITYLAHAGVQPPYYLVSARTGEGVKELKDAIRQRCSDIAKEVVR